MSYHVSKKMHSRHQRVVTGVLGFMLLKVLSQELQRCCPKIPKFPEKSQGAGKGAVVLRLCMLEKVLFT